MKGFIFGGDTGETPQSLAQKRAVAESLIRGATGRVPQNLGEGLASIGQALSGRWAMQNVMDQENEGLSGATKAFNDMLGPTSTASSVSPATPGNTSYRDAIASIESKGSGDYAAVGPTHPEMGRALGRYQIMESNIGPWSKEVLGRAVTPDEFMKNPQLQDQIFDGKFQSYVNKYGPEGAAQAWLGGPGGVGKLDRKDSLGTSIAEYGQRFTKALGTAQPGNLDPNVGGRWTPETKDNVYDPAAIQQKLMSIKGAQVASLNPQTNSAYPQTNPAILQAGGMYTPQTTDYRSPNPGVMDKNIEGMAYAPTQKPSGVVQALNNMATGSIPPNAPMVSTRGNSGMDVWQGRANQGTATDGTQLTRLADGSVQRTNRFGVTERMDGNGGGSVQSALMAGAQQPQQQAASPAPMVQQASPQVAQALQSPSQASQTGGIDPRALAVLSNPFATDGQRMVAQALIKQQQERSDPAYQLNLKKSQIELDRLSPDYVAPGDKLAQEKFDWEKQQSKDWQKLSDTTLFNPRTGETKDISNQSSNGFQFGGNSVEAQSLNGLMKSGKLTPEQAQQLGAGKTITGPNGEIIFLTPQGVFGGQAGQQPQPYGGSQGVDIFAGSQQSVSPPQQPATQSQPPSPQQTGMIPLTAPKVTESEKNAMTYADRMTQSGAIIDNMGMKGTSTFDQTVNDWVPFGLDSYVTSDDFKKVDQAKRDFINAQLRRESGAAIGASEFESANKQYFPQPNDTPDVIEQKRKNRETVIKGMVRDSGPTYKPPEIQTDEGWTELSPGVRVRKKQ